MGYSKVIPDLATKHSPLHYTLKMSHRTTSARSLMTAGTCDVHAHLKRYVPLGCVLGVSRLCNSPCLFHRGPCVAARSGN